jgi:hypothetical protein
MCTNMTYRQTSLYMKESYAQLEQLEFVNCVLYSNWEIDDLNVHVPTEDKNDDLWDSFYEELKCMFEQFKYHVEDFSAKVWRGDIFNLKIGKTDWKLGKAIYVALAV